MTETIKMALYWAGSCGGCDVSLLDTEERLLELFEIADLVYWPVAMDFKSEDLVDLPDQSLDFGLFNGAIRTNEHAEAAEILRKKSKVLAAYGSCACFGGIPGLANLYSKEAIIERVYHTTASTENPEGLRPEVTFSKNGDQLTLPDVLDTVKSLSQCVPVDLYLPGCPPPNERLVDLIDQIKTYADTSSAPAPGMVLASNKVLCEECPRAQTRTGGRIAQIYRSHERAADPTLCFLDQGMLCMGIATRGGCEATCIQANMPCRGCFGPLADMLDPGAEALSAIGSIAGEANENDVAAHEMKKAIRSIRDPAGTFYRFTLPVAFLNRAVTDRPKEETK
jgi:F420-non-reducing hydrogenase small subunit